MPSSKARKQRRHPQLGNTVETTFSLTRDEIKNGALTFDVKTDKNIVGGIHLTDFIKDITVFDPKTGKEISLLQSK